MRAKAIKPPAGKRLPRRAADSTVAEARLPDLATRIAALESRALTLAVDMAGVAVLVMECAIAAHGRGADSAARETPTPQA